jgi:L-ribulose-5-phosphate 4-epimerase
VVGNLSSAESISAAPDTVRIMREELASISRRAYRQGLVVGISGNNSVRVPGTDAILIKVTGVCQGDMDTADTVLVDLDGNVLEEGKRPSKEMRWHLAIYRSNPEVGGIVHVHPPYAVAWAVANRLPKLVHTAARGVLGRIALVDLAPSGSQELADLISDAFVDRALRVALMREHGIVAVGPDLRTAYYRAEYLEDTAKVALLAAQVRALGSDGGISLADERDIERGG